MNIPYPLPALYWMWRQRSHDVRSWRELLEDLPIDGARLAIVGNAGYLAQEARGPEIDGHDLVLRMNNFRIRGFEAQVGTRVDIYMSNFYVPDINFENPDIARARWMVSSRPNTFKKHKAHRLDLRYGEHLAEGLHRLDATTIYTPSLEFTQQVATELHECPTTGLMAILLSTDVLLERCASVHLTGFSFFEGTNHYFRDGETNAFAHHNIPTEKTMLTSRLAPFVAQGRISCDPTVGRHLGFEA